MRQTESIHKKVIHIPFKNHNPTGKIFNFCSHNKYMPIVLLELLWCRQVTLLPTRASAVSSSIF